MDQPIRISMTKQQKSRPSEIASTNKIGKYEFDLIDHEILGREW
jgi:hypothetical protein